jgi:exodeoxyribonuclease-5
MEWSPQQAKALAAAQEWLTSDADKRVFRLFGFAGTGKSTLAKTIGEMENRKPGGYTQYAAFTGKAAVVMKRKGCLNAKTLHSIIYSSHDKSGDTLEELNGKLPHAQGQDKVVLLKAIEEEKEKLRQPAFALKPDALTVWEEDPDYGERRPAHTITLFIIDECSMVDGSLGADVVGTGAKILVLGDPAQLPPVMAGTGYFTNAKPDALLTEIHRQAAESPIIKMANIIRSGCVLDLGDYGHGCTVVTAADIKGQTDLWMDADQILVGKNDTRRAFNGRIRQLKGFSGFLPEPGEKLVCLKNNHKEGLLNGSLWEAVEVEDKPKDYRFNLKIRSLDEDGRVLHTQVHKGPFLGQEINVWERLDANEFDFGYALTVHKSQGSQWDNVLLYDEWSNRQTKCQWQYTGITRAAERITVVRP